MQALASSAFTHGVFLIDLAIRDTTLREYRI
jgi:hypothetical protein